MPEMTEKFSCHLYSDTFAVREALSSVRSAWEGWGVEKDLCETGEQVLAEVLNNVVEHAHDEDPEGNIYLASNTVGEAICVEIRDDGRPMPNGALPAGELADLPDVLDDLPEGGFGWFMIRSLTSELQYERNDGWNTVRFRVDHGA